MINKMSSYFTMAIMWHCKPGKMKCLLPSTTILFQNPYFPSLSHFLISLIVFFVVLVVFLCNNIAYVHVMLFIPNNAKVLYRVCIVLE